LSSLTFKIIKSIFSKGENIMSEGKLPENETRQNRDDEDGEKSSLTNPIYWVIAFLVVVWLKWDEILIYLN